MSAKFSVSPRRCSTPTSTSACISVSVRSLPQVVTIQGKERAPEKVKIRIVRQLKFFRKTIVESKRNESE